MDKNSLCLLRYMEVADYRTANEIESFCRVPLSASLEFYRLEREALICIDSRFNDTLHFSITPRGREVLESHSAKQRHNFITYATFVIALLNFLFCVSKNI